MLNEFVSLLTLFADATTITQSGITPSILFVAPTVLAIYCDLLSEESNVLYTSSLSQVLLTSSISRFGGLLDKLDVRVDKTIARKCSSKLYRNQIFIYSPFLDGNFKLHWINECSLPTETKILICDMIR